ncbi:PQQ-dependent sugar dehydrogenase [Defluviimonas sp. WL0024]|uniref:PQQ-dependent sugar dehydrogenase n=1 Tax=Albidovulum salinarum TaxID=2984153 RepID=A0ABT2X0I6_9RHOB|nr:PQQ-dependent sugar dehydrogenase [Defluviimonas sp. WL0024]MCU9846819.1 PQQ-dependent sugar dehydrogenase [Defluviimonas sp. WL0024]
MPGVAALARRTVLALTFVFGAAEAAPLETTVGRLGIDTVAEGFREPWSLAFLPDGGFLVTEREGRLTRIGPGGAAVRVGGVPKVRAEGQGGLFDILVPRDFGKSGEVLLSFARPQGRGAGTAVVAARLGPDRLDGLRILWEMPAGSSGGRHFGGRLAEAPDGAIFLTIGERGAFDPAQDLDMLHGKIIRITRNGAAAPGNPFPDGAGGVIWSYGHRNPQGLAFDERGRLWASEHGARGGDEINLIERGANYGWPEIAYGRHYSGLKIGRGTSAPGMEQPKHYWDPSIAPSGHMIYSGKLWPGWRGHHFVGSLKFDYIARLDPEAGWAEEALKTDETARVRDIREAPDGTIWFLSVDRGAVYRIRPE